MFLLIFLSLNSIYLFISIYLFFIFSSCGRMECRKAVRQGSKEGRKEGKKEGRGRDLIYCTGNSSSDYKRYGRLSEKGGGGRRRRGHRTRVPYSYSRLRMIISYKYCTIYSPAIMLRLVFFDRMPAYQIISSRT